jgi:hypothetical protein
VTVNKIQRVATVVLLLALAAPVSACVRGEEQVVGRTASRLMETPAGKNLKAYFSGLVGVGGVGCLPWKKCPLKPVQSAGR